MPDDSSGTERNRFQGRCWPEYSGDAGKYCGVRVEGQGGLYPASRGGRILEGIDQTAGTGGGDVRSPGWKDSPATS